MAQVIRKSDPKAYERLEAIVKGLGKTELKVGWLGSNKYENGLPVAAAAMINEFGDPSKNIPPRPFMRPTIAREEGRWRKFIDQEARKIIAGTQTVENLLDLLGLSVSGEIARSISMVMAPPLHPRTIRNRKNKMANKTKTGNLTKPLVDTRLMITSVTYVVEES